MNLYLLYLICVFGPSILLTYWEIFQYPNKNELWGGWGRFSIILWGISTFLTVISFLFMSSVFIWRLDTIPEIEGIFAFYCVFFSGALLWGPFSLFSAERGEKKLFVFLSLSLAALGSVGIFVTSINLEESDYRIPLIITSFIRIKI